MEFFNLLLQKHTLSKPAIQPGQQNVANLPSSKLATGIKALQDVADDLFAPQRSEAEKGIIKVITAHLQCTFFHMNEEEVFEYQEGKSTLLGRLPRQLVQDLKFNIHLIMSRMRNLEMAEKSKSAREMIIEFHDPNVIRPDVQPLVAPFYIDQFRAMEIPNGNEYFKPLPPPMVPPGVDPALGGMALPPEAGAPAPGPAGAPVPPPEIEPL